MSDLSARVLSPGPLKAADAMYMEKIVRYTKLLEMVGHINLECPVFSDN